MDKPVCPECGGKREHHMADCSRADRENYFARMRAVRNRLEALGITPDDLLEFVEFSSRKNNFG